MLWLVDVPFDDLMVVIPVVDVLVPPRRLLWAVDVELGSPGRMLWVVEVELAPPGRMLWVVEVPFEDLRVVSPVEPVLDPPGWMRRGTPASGFTRLRRDRQRRFYRNSAGRVGEGRAKARPYRKHTLKLRLRLPWGSG